MRLCKMENFERNFTIFPKPVYHFGEVCTNLAFLRQIAQTIHPDVDVDNFDALILATGALLEHAYTEIQSMQNAADAIDNAIQNLRKQYKIGCLTTEYKNRLMWSHYGNSHQGICIEYDFANVDFLEAQTIPLPVYYSNTRPYFALTSAVPSTSINEHLDNVALQSLFCKDQIWSYENEWRILIAADADSNYLMPPISCIYLGAAIPNTYKHIIINVAQKCNIPVKQMTLDRTTYDLHAKSISPINPTSA